VVFPKSRQISVIALLSFEAQKAEDFEGLRHTAAARADSFFNAGPHPQRNTSPNRLTAVDRVTNELVLSRTQIGAQVDCRCDCNVATIFLVVGVKSAPSKSFFYSAFFHPNEWREIEIG